ncbi:MAG: saccharopine dehydrogenase C-terminal domain-containing protein [Acidobacteriota bacterium]
MRVLLLGVGAIGTVIAKHLAGHHAIESLTLSDMDTRRAEALAAELGGGLRVERIDAAEPRTLRRALEGHELVVNAILPRFNLAVMEAALGAGSHYLDLAAGDEDQFHLDAEWRKAGLLAVNGMGEDPGISNVYARYAADRLDTVESIRVRDGEFSEGGPPLACLFSTETFIEEATSPAKRFENGEFKRYPPRSNREVYPFPEPVGSQPVYSMNHEEVDTLPRFIGKGVKFVDFKLAVPEEMHRHLTFLESIGMTRTDTVRVRGGEVTPLSVLAAVLPQPADIGGMIRGAACILVEVDGTRDGKRTRHILYTAMTHDEAFRRQAVTATAYLTGTGGAAGVLAMATGRVRRAGVVPPEMLDPEPMLGLLEELGIRTRREEKAL